tara:strand:- start:188 stop:712 length:525 start_codon:yes stop_codon:yes gene_type:complete
MKSKNYVEIQAKAIWYLERYATSSENLRRYLKRKVYNTYLNLGSEEIINNIINELKDQRILNDKLFAEGKLKSLIYKGWSIKKCEFKLKELGIDGILIKECIEELVNDNSNLDLIAAAKLIKKRSIGIFRRRDLDDKVKNREFGIMSRAGFSYQITKKILTEMTKEELEKLYDW